MDESSDRHLTKKEKREQKRQAKADELQHRRKANFYKRVSIWSITLLAIAGAVFGITKLAGTSAPGSGQTALLTNAVSRLDQTRGNTEAGVVLVEYSDFQCPACGAYYPMVKQLNREFGDKIGFVYRHFPLKKTHKNAELAARAAEAAGKQGKFWEMHDMIFENQRTWSDSRGAKDIFIGYAESVGLDRERFAGDLDAGDVKDKVEGDYQSGIASGVNSTPTFFLNGQKLQNPRSYDEFKELVTKALGSNQ